MICDDDGDSNDSGNDENDKNFRWSAQPPSHSYVLSKTWVANLSMMMMMATMTKRMRTFTDKYLLIKEGKVLSWRNRSILTANAQANPLLLARRSCLHNGLVELLIAFADIHLRILCFLVNYLDSWFLLHHGGFEILE